ncbi:MAG TPA: hypothetical protein VF188_06050 [Longimicrobiales bacterium]
MTTRYEFGYGYGEIYRRRMRGQRRMHERIERERRSLPAEARERLRYESDYYGFRGAGRRGSYATEYQVQSRRPWRSVPRRAYRRGAPPGRRGRR